MGSIFRKNRVSHSVSHRIHQPAQSPASMAHVACIAHLSLLEAVLESSQEVTSAILERGTLLIHGVHLICTT
eukprot:1681230-Amphidinium_carterae.4